MKMYEVVKGAFVGREHYPIERNIVQIFCVACLQFCRLVQYIFIIEKIKKINWLFFIERISSSHRRGMNKLLLSLIET